MNFYQWGGKQLYYANSKDYKSDQLEDMITTEKIDTNFEINDDDNSCGDGGCSN